MDFKTDGGLAFGGIRPERVESATGEPTWAKVTHCGMSLRDWFAGQALTQWWISEQDAARITRNAVKDAEVRLIAEFCYRLADAMLRARAQPSEAQGPAAKQAAHIATWGDK